MFSLWIVGDILVIETMNENPSPYSGQHQQVPCLSIGAMNLAGSETRGHSFNKDKEHPLLVCNLHSGVLPRGMGALGSIPLSPK